MSHVSFLCKLVPPLFRNLFSPISQPILQITDKIRCIDLMRVSDHNKTIVDIIICVYDSLICKLVPPILKNLLFTLSRLILHITAQIRPRPTFLGSTITKDHSCINYVCPWHAMQILKCHHYRKCNFFAVSQPIPTRL